MARVGQVGDQQPRSEELELLVEPDRIFIVRVGVQDRVGHVELHAVPRYWLLHPVGEHVVRLLFIDLIAKLQIAFKIRVVIHPLGFHLDFRPEALVLHLNVHQTGDSGSNTHLEPMFSLFQEAHSRGLRELHFLGVVCGRLGGRHHGRRRRGVWLWWDSNRTPEVPAVQSRGARLHTSACGMNFMRRWVVTADCVAVDESRPGTMKKNALRTRVACSQNQL